MTTVIMMKNKAHEMKGLVEQGLNIFGKVMTMCSDMCEDGEMGERGGYGERNYDYPYGDRMGMREHMRPQQYPPQYPETMGERGGMPYMGRYGMYR